MSSLFVSFTRREDGDYPNSCEILAADAFPNEALCKRHQRIRSSALVKGGLYQHGVRSRRPTTSFNRPVRWERYWRDHLSERVTASTAAAVDGISSPSLV